MNKLIFSILIVFSLFFITHSIFAQHVEICICHNVLHNPETICVDDSSALESGGHYNHLDAGTDTWGACSTPTVTINPEPTEIPTLTPTMIPTSIPTCTPTILPTQKPTIIPTCTPTPTKPPYPAICQPYMTNHQSSINGTSVYVYNYNVLCATQKSSTSNNTGNIYLYGNIGTQSVTTGNILSTTNQNISGNTNKTTISIFKNNLINSSKITNTGGNLQLFQNSQ